MDSRRHVGTKINSSKGHPKAEAATGETDAQIVMKASTAFAFDARYLEHCGRADAYYLGRVIDCPAFGNLVPVGTSRLGTLVPVGTRVAFTRQHPLPRFDNAEVGT